MMEEKKETIKPENFEHIGFIQKAAPGSHSHTVAETYTLSYIKKEILKKQIRGEKLELRNDNRIKYFLVEDGTVFKYNTETYLFYQFDLETMTWYPNQSLASLYYDTYLKFEELLAFEDYFDTTNEFTINNGRQL